MDSICSPSDKRIECYVNEVKCLLRGEHITAFAERYVLGYKGTIYDPSIFASLLFFGERERGGRLYGGGGEN